MKVHRARLILFNQTDKKILHCLEILLRLVLELVVRKLASGVALMTVTKRTCFSVNRTGVRFAMQHLNNAHFHHKNDSLLNNEWMTCTLDRISFT